MNAGSLAREGLNRLMSGFARLKSPLTLPPMEAKPAGGWRLRLALIEAGICCALARQDP